MDRSDLVRQWDGLACSLAYKEWLKYRNSGIELDDLKSCGRLGLWEAALRWDSNRASFQTYAWPWVKMEIRDFVRDQLTRGMKMIVVEKAKCQLQPVARFSEGPQGRRPIEDTIEERGSEEHDRSGLWDELRPLLTEYEYVVVIARYRDEEDYGDIAERLGVSRRAVIERVHHAMRKLRRYFRGAGSWIGPSSTLAEFVVGHSGT